LGLTWKCGSKSFGFQAEVATNASTRVIIIELFSVFSKFSLTSDKMDCKSSSFKNAGFNFKKAEMLLRK
jgi:hypothetical protein